jgi:mono/diheme cytochrome c family protein
VASILDGKGKEMPSWRKKIDRDQARGLVAYIRTLLLAMISCRVQPNEAAARPRLRKLEGP